MRRDFFLLNRGYQIAKLCTAQPVPTFVLPAAKTRFKLPTKLKEFYALIDRIVERVGQQDLPSADNAEPQLPDNHRRDLEDLERTLVANRFSSDAAVKQSAVQLIRAIFADAEYFSGLKPLPQYTDVFAYELLFPSWLNLLSAVMLPRAVDGKPRLEGKRQAALFEFLGQVTSRSDSDGQILVAYLTFIASRFDAPECEELLQRLVDLYAIGGGQITAALDSMDSETRDARDFKQRIAAYLTVKYSMAVRGGGNEFEIAYRRPTRRSLPDGLSTRLAELEAAQDWNTFFRIAQPLRRLIDSKHFLSNEMASIVSSRPTQAAELLSLVVRHADQAGACVLSDEGQYCLAKLVLLESPLDDAALERLNRFAHSLAPGLEGLSEDQVQFFCRQLIDDEGRRQALLDCCGSDEQRELLAAQMLERAGNTDDNSRFLNLLGCVTILSPRAGMLDARNALRTIHAVVGNRTIGNKELNDLVGDLQANYLRATDYLASPMIAAAGKSPRIAALYLTLNEACQRLVASGTVENFSVLRAKYSALTNMEFD